MSTHLVTCPTCFEEFEVFLPPVAETPAEVDYDCEVCCRPMILGFDSEEDGVVVAWTRGLAD